MPRGRKKKIVLNDDIKMTKDAKLIQELLTQKEELKEDNKILAQVARNLREFNKDLVTDNLDSAQAINRLQEEVAELKAENHTLHALVEEQARDSRAKIIQAISITIVILAGLVFMGLGIWGK